MFFVLYKYDAVTNTSSRIGLKRIHASAGAPEGITPKGGRERKHGMLPCAEINDGEKLRDEDLSMGGAIVEYPYWDEKIEMEKEKSCLPPNTKCDGLNRMELEFRPFCAEITEQFRLAGSDRDTGVELLVQQA